MYHGRSTEDSHEESLMDVFKPALHFTALAGQEFYPSGYLTKCQKNLFKVLKCIVLLFLAFNIWRLCMILDTGMNTTKFVVFFVFLLFYTVEILTQNMRFIFDIVYGRRLQEKFAAYLPLTEQNYFRKLKRKVLFTVVFSAFIIIMSMLTIGILSITEFASTNMNTLLHIPMWKNTAFEIINYLLFSWFIASGIFSDHILLYFFVEIICCELHALSQKLKLLDDKKQTTGDVDSKLIHIQKKYEEIMELLHQVNTYFSIYLVTLFMLLIIIACVLIYVLFQKEVDITGKLLIALMAITRIVFSTSVLYSGITLQAAVEEPVEYLYRLSLNKEHSQDTMTRISLFFARVSNPSYLTAAKMFNIDSSTILMISGTLLSYGVIVFQTSSVHTGDKNASMTVLTGNMTGNATFG